MVNLKFESNANARLKRLENLQRQSALMAVPSVVNFNPVQRTYNVKDGPTQISEVPTIVFPPGRTMAKIVCNISCGLASVWNDQACPASIVALQGSVTGQQAAIGGTSLPAPYHIDATPGAAPVVGSFFSMESQMVQLGTTPTFNVAVVPNGSFSGFTSLTLSLIFDFQITYF